jgi:hypothetical protein
MAVVSGYSDGVGDLAIAALGEPASLLAHGYSSGSGRRYMSYVESYFGAI